MELTAILRQHLALCEEAYQCLLEENRLLKRTGQPPDEALLNGKRNLLQRLDSSLAQLQAANSGGAVERSPELKELITKAQQSLLKTLLLDRENEQLLLKTASGLRSPPPAAKPGPSQLQRLYEKHSRS